MIKLDLNEGHVFSKNNYENIWDFSICIGDLILIWSENWNKINLN